MYSIFNYLLPSIKIKKDIQFQYNTVDNIKPISIQNVPLIYPTKKSILQKRKEVSLKNIDIQRDQKKLSLIIPYRNRQEHLTQFIPYIEEVLKEQSIDYEIIIVEQVDKKMFNRAKLMNIGTLHARQDTDYFIFHDVDLLPLNVDYRYCNHTLKLFNYIIEDDKKVEYAQWIFGGVILIPKTIFTSINGFSNNYWQWGKEDDDFFMRHLLNGYVPLYDSNGTFKAMPHPPSIKTTTDGNVAQNKKILKENKNAYLKNKKTYSLYKRGLSSNMDDGLSTISDYRIESISIDNNIKTIKIVL